jgi:hypothetical protein
MPEAQRRQRQQLLGADVLLVRRTVALVAWTALLGAGCSKATLGATVFCSPPECAYQTSLALVAEVDPPTMGPYPYVKQEFTSLTINATTGLFTLQLAAPATIQGTVSIADSSGGKNQPVAATIVAHRPSRISGRPDVYYQATSDPITGAYQLVVSPNVANEQYLVRVTPTDPTLVPPTQEMVTAIGGQQLDFSYADPLVLPELHGTVTDSLQQGVAGMQVQASDAMSGAAVSTTAVTDATGKFSLRLLASRPSLVQLTASQAPVPNNAPAPAPLPTLSRQVMLLDGMTFGSSVEANLELPPLPAPAHINYGILSQSLSGALTPVVGATCVFTADVSDPKSIDSVQAIFTATALTDANGTASVSLIPAQSGGNRSYDVSITPDPASPFQATTTTVKVAPGGGYTQVMGLAIRPQLYGLVRDPTNRPLAGVTVTPMSATLAQSNGSPSPLRTAPTSAPPAMTGQDGHFSLRLDPAVWDVGLIPPPETMLPRLWVTGTNVISNTDLGEPTFPRGVMVHGVVRDASNRPVPVADVLIYTVASGNANCAPNDLSCLAPARLRAEGPTDAKGTVGIILPNKPVD